ncbi:hypothetical protein KI809_17325 [Geobacter pelophilus]|jgi:hypothetical protein|uniref:Uncharacterized protein n=1 Tax=Geoanaerobacter pelophilus TaxID=60036 RepID=A0AAW4L7D3_9BACT|nr:hypothetical protein [Geoanaerobacter pelophilus]MBT0666077.1 hypothetical protein [Geoanaerobacter pelophilus]
MMILVRYLDGTYDMVMNYHLDDLIRDNRIIGFERANRWVTIGLDPVRGSGGIYLGQDRRLVEEQESSPVFS